MLEREFQKEELIVVRYEEKVEGVIYVFYPFYPFYINLENKRKPLQ
jgi:hypothetical protein